MLKPTNRLKSKIEFLKLRKYGRTVQTPIFNFSYLFNKSLEGKDLPGRFGFIISNRVAKSSVIRNRTKRVLREGVRLFLKDRQLENRALNTFGVFIIKRAAVGKNYEEVNHLVNKVLSEVFKF